MTEHADGGDRIVVGVDGSEASRAALRWATEAARRLGAEVVAVHAWDPAPALAPYARVRDRAQQAAQRERAAEVLAAAVRETVGPRVDPAVRAVLVEGPAARVLLQQSRGALLLALGLSRPVQDGLRPAVSPVGRECLRGSPVPVVAVPVPVSERPVPALRAVGPYEVVV